MLRPKLGTPKNSISNEEFHKQYIGTNITRKENGEKDDFNDKGSKCNSSVYSLSNQCDINHTKNDCIVTDKISINTSNGATRIETVAKIKYPLNKVVWKNDTSAVYEGITF